MELGYQKDSLPLPSSLWSKVLHTESASRNSWRWPWICALPVSNWSVRGLFCLFCFWNRSYLQSPYWPGTHYIAESHIDLILLLYSPPSCWKYRSSSVVLQPDFMCWGRDSSVFKSTGCSYRGPGFHSQHTKMIHKTRDITCSNHLRYCTYVVQTYM